MAALSDRLSMYDPAGNGPEPDISVLALPPLIHAWKEISCDIGSLPAPLSTFVTDLYVTPANDETEHAITAAPSSPAQRSPRMTTLPAILATLMIRTSGMSLVAEEKKRLPCR